MPFLVKVDLSIVDDDDKELDAAAKDGPAEATPVVKQEGKSAVPPLTQHVKRCLNGYYWEKAGFTTKIASKEDYAALAKKFVTEFREAASGTADELSEDKRTKIQRKIDAHMATLPSVKREKN